MKQRVALLAFLLSFGTTLPLGAYDRPTHTDIAQRAARSDVSSLDGVLKDELGSPDGIAARFPRPSRLAAAPVAELIGDGADFEDDPFFRSLRHFHNPLVEPWDRAGLFGLFQSSVLWQQNALQDSVAGGGNWSWQDARDWYLKALTGSAPADRASAFGATFEALGHLTHLIQDASVPAHVRNDPHPILDGYERHVDRLQRALAGSPRRERFESLLSGTSSFDPTPVFAPTDHPQAPVPVARLIDSDTFRGANFEVLRLPSLGIAEYTNGNFLSDDTRFTDFALPRRSALGADFFEPEGPYVRRYFEKAFEGETVRHFVAESSLYDPATAILGQPAEDALTLTRLVYEDYAAKLLPLAVRYSAALLDYFFRGRLDVDLVDDGGGLRLVGANASREALDGGTLTVYADGTDGVRRPASAETGVGRVESGNTLPAVAVAPSEGAERFVAVYTGALGEERPAGTFPGGVIGKVLGGYRLEELFSDGTRWNLRTPKGIFPLPILRIDIVDLRWGDADNTLVGRTAFGTGQPNKLRAYQLNRLPGSVDVPLRAATGGGQEVDVQQTAEATFPIGLDVGGLQLNSTIDYQQYLISFVHTTVYSQGVLVSDTYSDGQAERVVNGSASTTFDWRLTLDLAKFNNFRARPYLWQLQQIGLTADGRLVALVRIRLTQLEPSLPESFAVFPSKRFVWCGQGACSSPPAIQDGPPAWVAYGFGRGAQNHWTLVDVTQGRVVYSTAAGGVVINNTIQVTRFRESGGGPFQGLVATEIPLRTVDGNSFYAVDPQDNLRFGSSCNPPAGSGFYEVSRVELPFGVSAASARQYRPELARTEFPPFAEHLLSQEKACLAAAFGLSPFAFVVVASDEARVYLNDALAAFRVPDGSERVALLFILGQALATNFRGDYARVVGWDPLAQSASLRHEVLTGDLWQLITAARGVAVIGGINSPALTAVPLEGNQPATAFPMTLGNVFNFRALSPAFLYNVQDQKFYRYQPGLLKTALPATLAAGGSAAGDYHAVRLP